MKRFNLPLLSTLALSLLAALSITSLPQAGANITNPPSLTIPGFTEPPPQTQVGNFYGGFFTNDAGAHIDTSGSAWFANVNASSTVAVGEALTTPLATITGVETLKTNAISNWPTFPASRGACTLVNSNGTLYALMSGANGNAWTKTNLLSAP